MKALILCLLPLTFYGACATADDYEQFKLRNKPDFTKCIDLRKQNVEQRRLSKEFADSLNSFLKVHLTEFDQKKRINGAISGTGTEGTDTVFVFYGNGGLATKPGQALRLEHRSRLEKLVAEWKVSSPSNQTFFVRFDDECEVPVVEWK